MTDKEIFEKAVLKLPVEIVKEVLMVSKETNQPEPDDRVSYYYIIFNHQFLKAFFGEGYYYIDEGYTDGEIITLDYIKQEDEEHLIETASSKNYHWYQPVWAYHAQQMVVQNNPLQYLEQFLDKE